ncbi:MAG: TrkA family potassium uptake protein [Elusimicrobia bacterium]|nr:TrkA family potassium uptake protein [Elusimicrobiota bacterium]
MLKQISHLKNHYIICGAGKVGSHIISELAKTKRDFVIIDNNKELLNKFSDYLCLNGDASDENVLKEGGIENAAGLFASLSTDEENIFLIITAREINPNIKIIAKSVKDTSAKKLITAGATSVVQPSLIGGLRMASEMVRPTAVSFLDIMLKEGKGDLRVEEIEVKNTAVKVLSEIQTQKTGVLLLAIVSKSGYVFNPAQNTVVQQGDKLIVMGNAEQVSALKKFL